MKAFKVLGVNVHAVQIPDVVARIEGWILERTPGHYVAVTGMHGVMEARQNSDFRNVLSHADLVVPDGMPLVWLSRWYGHALKRRVYGPELMDTFMRETRDRYTHFFYGAAHGVPELLAETFRQRYGVRVVGAYSPPFRPLTEEEKRSVADMIESVRPDVLWVGLSTPKQERWMHEHRGRLSVPVMLGVGAAFDIHSGKLTQAPRWMREHGLEWLFRVIEEPRRLWRRYFILGSKFVWNVSMQVFNLKEFD
jgi:N-acetylglucosaminyldiphosphoundecaprenol N-acetyl-beta-D-mannosaminyltransferase